jgi:hypothetical protein
MICCAETTLPSSRVRSEALSTNLFQRVLSGLRVMGTVCGSLILAFFGFAGSTTKAETAGFACGSEAVSMGAGTELIPAGCLAAAESRAARLLALGFFFMDLPIADLPDGVTSQYCDGSILQLSAVVMSRHHGTLLSKRCNSTTP